MVDKIRIANTINKFDYYLNNHNCICVGVSGGSDSNIIVHIICKYFKNYIDKIHFVFNDTGIEYGATYRHLKFIQDFYGINIDVIKSNGIIRTVNKCGFPILSKEFSHTVYGVQKGWNSCILKIKENKKENKYAMSNNQKLLAKYLLDNNVKVSDRCCDNNKKNPYKSYLKKINADLTITGERMSEGGIRASAHKSCFEIGKNIDKFMPLFFWNDDTKEWFKNYENIKFSDCYEVYGMKRTGCVGCPFNSHLNEDLKSIKKYEPKLYNICINVFGISYAIMDLFNVRRNKIFSGDCVKREIERRFTVNKDNIPFNEQTYACEIKQVYVSDNPSTRIREISDLNGIKFYHCVKYKISDIERVEIEEEISKEDYEAIYNKVSMNPISKKRISIPLKDGNICTVDYFYDIDKYIVEVEFNSKEEAEDFIAPEWFVEEVTGKKIGYSVFKKINNKEDVYDRLSWI